MKKAFFTKRRLIVLSIIIGWFFLNVFDIFIDPPAWWRFKRQRDKWVILEYVRDNYPNTIKRKGGSFPLQMPAGPIQESVMFFELDGVRFGIAAENGKIIRDSYTVDKTIDQFDKIIIDGFMKPRNINNVYTDYSFLDSYSEMYPYTGGLMLRMSVFDQGSTPQEVGWLYDFYKYWEDEGSLLSQYGVGIDITQNDTITYHIRYNSKKKLAQPPK